jgi:transcriptional regulator with XRE-family HTH domain
VANALGDRIRELREANDTYRSLRHFANALGKSPSWVSKLERNEERPGDETLILIARLLNADQAELFELARRLEPDVHQGLAERYGELSGLLRTIKSMPADKVEELTAQARQLAGDDLDANKDGGNNQPKD